MARLTVRDFSCIDQATLDIARLTVLIGPQASGKSVLSKLIYFFQEALLSQATTSHIELEIDALKAKVTSDFIRWFPVSAWGLKKFHIEFATGDYVIQIDRKKSYKKPSEGFHVTFSPVLEEHFEKVASSAVAAMQSLAADTKSQPYMHWEVRWSIQKRSQEGFKASLGDEFVAYQMFVPAGRAFFTSVGKAVSAFEHSGFLDPATLAFGRFWAAIRDSDPLAYRLQDTASASMRLMTEIFGGVLVHERDVEYVLSPDGRKVPLSALSSGQQELLPLWMTIERYFADDDESADDQSMMYIEEPEAHLFPHAQSKLVEFLTSKLYLPAKNKRRMLLTTHSPYVLAKINNLVKAHITGKKASKAQVAAITDMLPRVTWLKPDHLRAYAIIDRKLVSITNDDGLIDAAYLDQVSDDIMNQFSSLLEIEYA